MAILKESTRLLLMAVHGLAMVALGLILLYIRAAITDRFYYVFGIVLALLLLAASLLFIAVLDWICAIAGGPHQVARLRGLLLVSTAAAGFGVFAVLYPYVTIRMFSYAIALYALMLSIGKFRLVKEWTGTPRQQRVMFLLATIAFVFSVLLVAVANRDERDVLAVIAGYALYMGFQMLLTMYYLMQRPLSIFEQGPSKTHA